LTTRAVRSAEHVTDMHVTSHQVAGLRCEHHATRVALAPASSVLRCRLEPPLGGVRSCHSDRRPHLPPLSLAPRSSAFGGGAVRPRCGIAFCFKRYQHLA
jgi:hypothetical protein